MQLNQQNCFKILFLPSFNTGTSFCPIRTIILVYIDNVFHYTLYLSFSTNFNLLK